MCNCQNVEMGSYDNQIELKAPDWSIHETICVDKCIKEEIQYLWDNNVETTGSCCGHNKVKPMINVKQNQELKMKFLGYKYIINQFDVKCYLPKL